MKIHEYQAKEFFRRNGIPVPRGRVVASPEDASQAAADIPAPIALKAQILAGGRGKGGGVKLAASPMEVAGLAAGMIGSRLVTPQTGPTGSIVHKILVEEGISISREFYLSIAIDRGTAKIVILASADGGTDIEETAYRAPERVTKIFVDPLLGLQPYHCRKLVFFLGLREETGRRFTALLTNLYKLFIACDCGLIEINPLAMTTADQLLALDAKMEVDDNALFRHPELQACPDIEDEDPMEVEASKFGLRYLRLPGTIGSMVNGAGLAMATMDLIKKAGEEPANFLDLGGGATAATVENGLRILLKDQRVKAILVNIFGGILRCDHLAAGIVTAATKWAVNVPLIIRLEGTNAAEGRRILAQSQLDIIPAADLREVGEKIARLGKAA